MSDKLLSDLASAVALIYGAALVVTAAVLWGVGRFAESAVALVLGLLFFEAVRILTGRDGGG